jgi:hypothetical protein
MAETSEQARTRRRWISLAEFVAVAGLLIGAATLYLNWSDRREDKAAQAAASASEGKVKSVATLTGAAQRGGDTLALTDAAHTLTEATVRFPAALKVAVQDAMPGPAIQASWFAPALLAATDKGPDEQSGRLPVLVTVGWWDGDTKRTSTARYDLLWRTHGRMLQGRKVELTGIALVDRTASAVALDKAWSRQKRPSSSRP